LRAGLFSLAALALCSCSSSGDGALEFPISGDDAKSDVFGRSLIGKASPYEPDLSLSDPEMVEALRTNMQLRRQVAWQTTFKALEPVPLLGLAEVSEENPEVILAGGAVPEVPRFQTWLGVDDAKRIFKRIYDQLGAAGRRARSPVSDSLMADAFHWNESAVERSDRWPLDRYLKFVKELGVCPAELSAEECAQSLTERNAGAAAGNSRILYSPGTIRHVMSNYSSVLDCLDRLETLPMETQPASEENFTECFNDEFPADAALIKAHWVRADFGKKLPAFDTDAEAMQRHMDGTATWLDAGDRETDPSTSDVYTIKLRNGNTFRLAGLHVMTKEMRHWQWVTLWWSDKENSDFGADRPEFIQKDLPAVWSNYKMCAVTWFEEEDPELAQRYQSLPSLGAALAATGGLGEPTWCSNPYLEHGRNNARTNCIGCHQHGGSRVAYDIDEDGILDPLDLETIISNETLFPDAGRTQIRDQFPADYLYSFNKVDDLAGMIKNEVDFYESTDKNAVSERINSILGLQGEAARGEITFAAVCAACHGSDGLGTAAGPSLGERVPSRSDEDLLQSILQGRGDMPAWQENFVDSEFADLFAFLRATF
jgi:mono/diheme cytochrome c family protein